MFKALYLFLTLLTFPAMNSSSEKINLEEYSNSFSWNKRVVLLITEESDAKLIIETDGFFKRNRCENEIRNLEYIRIVGDDVNKYVITDRYESKYGIWLIGYDGRDKFYTTDASLLKEIHDIIDKMPIRQIEMAEQNKKCD